MNLMALVSCWEGDTGWNSLSSDKLWQEQESGQACCRTEHSLVRTQRPWETQGRNANRKMERDREGKKRWGDSNARSTLQGDTEDALPRLLWCLPIWSQSQRPFTSGFTISVSSIMAEVHQHHWWQPFCVLLVKFLAPFHSFRLCGLLPFDCPDVPRLPRFAEFEGNAFADLPTVLVWLFSLLILYLFCLYLRQFFFL